MRKTLEALAWWAVTLAAIAVLLLVLPWVGKLFQILNRAVPLSDWVEHYFNWVMSL